jgi:hypothetical protein
VELNPSLVILSRALAWRAGLRPYRGREDAPVTPAPPAAAAGTMTWAPAEGGGGGGGGAAWPAPPPPPHPVGADAGTATFSLRNLFDTPLSRYDVVMVFGVVPIMGRLEAKLAAEAPPHALVCSHKFALPGTHGYTQVADVDGIRVYARTRPAAAV